jgi:hypothetical protein
MRVSLSSLVPSSRSGFCGRIMPPNRVTVYMRRSIILLQEKARCFTRSGLKSNPWGMEETALILCSTGVE